MLRRIVLISLCGLVLCASEGLAQKKTRLAVASFASGCANLPKESNVGQGIADMIITELFKVKQFEIIERNRLDQIMAEKNLAQTDLVEPNAAATAAKLLNCDAIVVGSITEYSQAEKTKNMVLGSSTRSIFTVRLQFRIVDAATGQTRLTASAVGEAEKKGGSLDVGRIANRWSPVGLGSMGEKTTGSDAFMGEASEKAVKQIVEKIRYAFPPEGYVIKLEGDTVLIDLGKSADVRQGDKFKIIKVGEAIKHPVTGKLIQGESEEIGTLEVEKVVAEELSKCRVLAGQGRIEVGNKIVGEIKDLSAKDKDKEKE
ncbi:MAG: CsgG/HfaB family protein [Planctomycetota bacterium]